MRFIRETYLPNGFFFYFGGVGVLFALSFGLPVLETTALATLILGVGMVVLDGLLLFRHKRPIVGHRSLPEMLSLGDENAIYLDLTSTYTHEVKVTVIDDLPNQLQIRNMQLYTSLKPGERVELTYSIRPTERGAYQFGNLNLFIHSFLGLLARRQSLPLAEPAKVYPSVIQMKRFELKAFARISHLQGIKKIRRLGHSYEFEQIKNYVEGDDIRSINWKATSRQGNIMVNHYEDEKSQQIYSLIDKSRSMKLPFHGLSLMDHSINTSLVLSNIALLKHDRAGLLTFSDKIGSLVPAEAKRNQLQLILEALYAQEERTHEANYEVLYAAVRQAIKRRSLLILYTNFESMYAMQRVLPILRKINRQHLLLVMFFENTEIESFTQEPAQTTEEMYIKTIAEKYLLEKKQIIGELRRFGIQAMLTRPADLTVHTINKYLEFKSRGLI
jgi:uncharacterized protein (DUF58 family)